MNKTMKSLTPVEWRISEQCCPYLDAISWMERRVADIYSGKALETVWLLEHPSIYTAGTSAHSSELLKADKFPVHKSGRGGRYTYHGPGQRIAYTMLDLTKRRNDLRQYVYDLETWLIHTLAEFSILGERREDRIGIWVRRGTKSNSSYREYKIAAIGIRVRKWIAYHGVSLNIEPDLRDFEGIIPCGVDEHGITSLLDLGITASTPEVDTALKKSFEQVFRRKTSRTILV